MFQELTSIDYIKCEIACKHDKAFEKRTWDERLNHFEHLKTVEDELTMYKKASNPIGLKSAMNAYRDAITNTPTGYIISLDACSSGLQLLSLLSGCQKSFELCGGISDDCVDSYTALYGAMDIGQTLSRKQVKKAIMTSLYGSTSTPEEVFADNIDVFYDTMETMAPGAWDLNIGLQDLWDEVEGNTYSWTLPDNFNCHIETHKKEWVSFDFLDQTYQYPKKIAEKPAFHKGIGPNIIHSIDALIVREIGRRCMFDEAKNMRIIAGLNSKSVHGEHSEMVKLLWWNYKASGFLSARILDYLTEETMGLVEPMVIALMIQQMPEKPFSVVSVHDCFKCHANYGNDLRRQYNYIMAGIAESDMLAYIGKQVTENPALSVNKFGSIPTKVITEGNYLLA